MSVMSVEQIMQAVEQLAPEERATLMERLRTMGSATAQLNPELDLLIFDVGPWPEGMTLRREDEYGDDQR